MTDEVKAVEADLLPSEIAKLEAEVRTEIEREQKKKLKDAKRAEIKAKLEQASGIIEPLEDVYIDLAKHASYIMLDGVKYLHGRHYTVRASVAATINEIIQAGQYHQAEIDGHNKRYYTERNAQVSPVGWKNVNTTSALLRA